jgi:hypothetical protein
MPAVCSLAKSHVQSRRSDARGQHSVRRGGAIWRRPPDHTVGAFHQWLVSRRPCKSVRLRPWTARLKCHDLFGQSHLLLGPLREICRLHLLRRLGLGGLDHTHRHDTVGVEIQFQLDLLVLGMSLVCNLLCAGLSVKTRLVMYSFASGPCNSVASPPARSGQWAPHFATGCRMSRGVNFGV